MPFPTLPQLLNTLKKKFDDADTSTKRARYKDLMIFIALVFSKNCSFQDDYTRQDVETFFDTLLHPVPTNSDFVIDELITGYNNTYVLTFDEIKWNVKSERQKNKEERQRTKEKMDKEIKNITRRK